LSSILHNTVKNNFYFSKLVYHFQVANGYLTCRIKQIHVTITLLSSGISPLVTRQ